MNEVRQAIEYVATNAEAIATAAQGGDKIAAVIVVTYVALYRSRSDPGAQGIFLAAVADYRRLKQASTASA